MTKIHCAAPWRGLHINPRGDVKTCCAGDPNMLGNLNEHTIDEILTGPALQRIRQTIRKGELDPEYCYNCIQAERYGRSERDWHNSVNADFDPATASDTDHVPVIVDVRWNTTCNLSCNYCGDKCSSRWATLKNIPVKSGARPYYESVCEYLAQHRGHIKEVALVGGEPLLLPENERLLDVLPDDCIVTLITNVSVDLINNKIFEKLKTRSQVGWSLSFDNIDQRFEYVRYGGNWELVQRNLDTLTPLMKSKQHWGGIHAVYNLYNATRLVEFTEFARSRDLTIHWQSLYQPECLDPTRLGNEVLSMARQEIEKLLSLNICLDNERQFFENVLSGLSAKDDLTMQFRQHIDEIENQYHRNQRRNFRLLWPELSELLNDNQ
jgi:MoaA/NifB/PqqE/SkfB family radical SAM enzyme